MTVASGRAGTFRWDAVSAVVASHASAGPDDAIGRGFVVCAALLGVAALCSLGLFRRR